MENQVTTTNPRRRWQKLTCAVCGMVSLLLALVAVLILKGDTALYVAFVSGVGTIVTAFMGGNVLAKKYTGGAIE